MGFNEILDEHSSWNTTDEESYTALNNFNQLFVSGNEENRAVYTKYFVEAAKKYGITCIYWDDGGSMGIIDRNTYEWTCPKVRDAIVNAE